MQITNRYHYYTNFKATKVATAYNYAHGNTAIDIFKMSQSDKVFLEKLSKKVSIKESCPKLLQSVQERWQKVFDYCIQEAKEPDNCTYLAVSEGRPCGILTYHEESSKNNYLDGVCAIPDSKGKKIPLTGRSLLYQLFKDSSGQKEKKGIILDAIHDGPIDVVQMYEGLNFTPIAANDKYTIMSCNKFKVAKEIDNFKRNIEYHDDYVEHVNLEEILD